MNTYVKLLLGCGLALTGWAQGQLNVANRNPFLGIDAPVFDVDCTTRLEGAAYAAQAYAGLEPDSLVPYGPILGFRTGAYAGYITSTVVTFPPEMTFRWLYFQLRAWEVAAGSSFEAAAAGGGKYGVSNLVLAQPIPPPGGPGDVFGLQSFCLVPEPSSGALLALGGVAWLALARGHGMGHRLVRAWRRD